MPSQLPEQICRKKPDIKDNADLLYSDILKAGGGLAHKELARRIADESVSNYKWLRDEVGVKFKAVTYHGGVTLFPAATL